LLLSTGGGSQFGTERYLELDLQTGRERTVLSSKELRDYAHARGASLGQLAYSADGQYVAALAQLPGNGGVGVRAIVIAKAVGPIVRVVTSRDVISMFAWSPLGNELAYTTSGFPAPHELYVLDTPQTKAWRVLSQAPHFDWVTWSPDARWLLIDNEMLSEWELLHLVGHKTAPPLGGASVPTRRLPRLGGMPLWCCPADHYAGE
jgi:Tol biopolymer transport system component